MRKDSTLKCFMLKGNSFCTKFKSNGVNSCNISFPFCLNLVVPERLPRNSTDVCRQLFGGTARRISFFGVMRFGNTHLGDAIETQGPKELVNPLEQSSGNHYTDGHVGRPKDRDLVRKSFQFLHLLFGETGGSNKHRDFLLRSYFCVGKGCLRVCELDEEIGTAKQFLSIIADLSVRMTWKCLPKGRMVLVLEAAHHLETLRVLCRFLDDQGTHAAAAATHDQTNRLLFHQGGILTNQPIGAQGLFELQEIAISHGAQGQPQGGILQQLHESHGCFDRDRVCL